MAWTVPEMKEEKKETIIRNLQFIYCSIMPALGTQKLGQHVVHEGKENWTMGWEWTTKDSEDTEVPVTTKR